MTIRGQVLAALALSSTALLVAAACGPGFLQDLTGGRATDDAGKDTGASMPGDGCDPDVPPGPPDGGDAPEVPEIYFAFDEIKIDTSPSVDGGVDPPGGYDLDGLCTCHPSAAACVPAAAAADKAGCDLSGGRDNALGMMFDVLRQNIPQATSDFATNKIQQGIFTVIVDVKGWNGTKDDPRVTVTLYGSQGLDRTDGGSPLPRFDGKDTWTLDPASLAMGDAQIGQDCRLDVSFCVPQAGRVAQVGNAYVRNGTLVARFASVPLNIFTNVGSLIFDLDLPELVATIGTDDAGRHRLTGQFIGRWPTRKALPAISVLEFPDPISKKIVPLCTNDSFYQLVKTVVCSETDLPGEVDGGATEPCGAISSAIAFSASAEARPSFVYRRTDGGGPCATFTDRCLP